MSPGKPVPSQDCFQDVLTVHLRGYQGSKMESSCCRKGQRTDPGKTSSFSLLTLYTPRAPLQVSTLRLAWGKVDAYFLHSLKVISQQLLPHSGERPVGFHAKRKQTCSHCQGTN